MELKQCLLTNNDCYKKGQIITPKGIIVHSTGANNPNLKRYIQPDDGILGDNKYNNDWNRTGLSVCVHAFIGKDKNGEVRCYQTLPFNYACWGVGKGSKGSYNYNPAYIQFEICEDDLTDKDYFTKAFDLAAEFCAYLIKEYNLSIDDVISHHEANLRGYGSNHSDCDHWLNKFGKTMDDFRNDVRSKLGDPIEPTTKVDIIYQSYDNSKKQWLGIIKNYNNLNINGYAGNFGNSIGGIRAKLSDGSKVTIKSHIKGGSWLSAITKWDDTSNGYSGIKGKAIDGVCIKADNHKVSYRVHTVNGKWLGWISQYDTNDWVNGVAGIKGKAIDCIQIKVD